MKLAILAASMAEGGAERVALNLAREIAIAGHCVHLVLVRAEGGLLREVPSNVRIVDLESSRARRSIFAFTRYLRAERPDAALAINFDVNLTAALAIAAIKPKPPLLLSVHMPISPWLAAFAWPQRQVMAAVSRLLYRRADRVVAVSHGIAKDLQNRGWAKGRRIEVIHNPVLPHGFEALASAPFEHPWLHDEAIPCVVSLGRLTKLKNQALLITAFERMIRSSRARLLIAGDGECREALEQRVSASGLEENVSFVGHLSNPYPFLRAADLFALSSDREGFGNVLVEAMAVGTPVVATDCDFGPREILEKGRWGLLVPPGDADALAAAMLAGLQSPRDTAVDRAREFTALAKSAEYLHAIERVLQERRA